MVFFNLNIRHHRVYFNKNSHRKAGRKFGVSLKSSSRITINIEPRFNFVNSKTFYFDCESNSTIYLSNTYTF